MLSREGEWPCSHGTFAASVAVALTTRHGMDAGEARELVRSVREPIEFMYGDGMSPAVVARRIVQATRDGITESTALARALNNYACSAEGAIQCSAI